MIMHGKRGAFPEQGERGFAGVTSLERSALHHAQDPDFARGCLLLDLLRGKTGQVVLIVVVGEHDEHDRDNEHAAPSDVEICHESDFDR